MNLMLIVCKPSNRRHERGARPVSGKLKVVLCSRTLIELEQKTAAQRDVADQFFKLGGGVVNNSSLFPVFVLREAERRRLFLPWSDQSDQQVFIVDGSREFDVLGWTSQTTYLDTQR